MTTPGRTDGPLVTVLVPTFNRRWTLREALGSLAAQTYANFEALVVNDGGVSVRDIVDRLADPRVVLTEREANRGKAASLNEALAHARGTYVAYLDDDDILYPHHLQRLVETLEAQDDCGVAYTDLYKVHYRKGPGGRREVLGKVVSVSRDFDRFFLCCFNHTLHVSVMHRRDLLERTGPYDESLAVLIDWDMTRRLAFFTDFVHVPEVTGEFYAAVKGSDRLSEKGRQDRQAFIATTLAIRAARPPKPWPKMPDLSVVLLPGDAPAAGDLIRNVYAWTFMPYAVYLPMPEAALGRLRIGLPNFVPVPTPPGADPAARLDAALARLEGDHVAVVPPDTAFGIVWAEDALHASLGSDGRTAFALQREGDSPGDPGFVMPADALRRVREASAGAPVVESLRAAGVTVRPPTPEEQSLRFDRALQQAEGLEQEGNWLLAADCYRRMAEAFANTRWMAYRRARALYEAGGRDADALDLCRDLNRRQPTADTLLLEARLHRRAERVRDAVDRLQHARRILVPEKGTPCN